MKKCFQKLIFAAANFNSKVSIEDWNSDSIAKQSLPVKIIEILIESANSIALDFGDN